MLITLSQQDLNVWIALEEFQSLDVSLVYHVDFARHEGIGSCCSIGYEHRLDFIEVGPSFLPVICVSLGERLFSGFERFKHVSTGACA